MRGDPRLDELRRMALPRVQLEIAEMLGVDKFLQMWRRLDGEPACNTDRLGMLVVMMRPYKSYLRFQRNRFIETLNRAGYNVREIRQALKERLGETVSLSHISRLVRKNHN